MIQLSQTAKDEVKRLLTGKPGHFVRVGVKGESAVTVGQRLLNQFRGLTGLHRAPFAELKNQHGLGIRGQLRHQAAQ